MRGRPRVFAGQASRFGVLAALLFLGFLVQNANEVIATTGFISAAGAGPILWLWAADAVIVIVTSTAFSLIVDRVHRARLAMGLFAAFSVAYSALYAVFSLDAPRWLCYTLLLVINNQQVALGALVLWALAADAFSVAEGKRLMGLLGIAALAGGAAGDGLTAATAWLGGKSAELLLLNGVLMLAGAVFLRLTLGAVRLTVRQADRSDGSIATLRAGLGFVRQVPAYRYLALGVVLAGLGWTIMEYELFDTASRALPDAAALQVFYGTFKVAVSLVLLFVRGGLAGWLMGTIGFQQVFLLLPAMLLLGPLVTLLWPGVIGVGAGVFLLRITGDGVDHPSRQAFLGLVPDELRGRISAFMEGYLLPVSFIASCALLAPVQWAAARGLVSHAQGATVAVLIALACGGLALFSGFRLKARYDVTLLNWRLQRRRRQSVLNDLDF
jgi:ATP:ADP antiporter, AAA family